jgi:hypothetical protein
MRCDLLEHSREACGVRRNPAEIVALAKRRAYNRAYMRMWRSDPRHHAREHAAREKAYLQRKLREALRDRSLSAEKPTAPICGLCGKLPPVREILRLRIRETPRAEFVKIRVPYCGQC